MSERRIHIADLIDKARRQAPSLEYIANANDHLSQSQVQSILAGADLLEKLANALDIIYITRPDG